MLVRPLLVRRRLRETHDTFTLELDLPAENGHFEFKPGQFNMLYAYGVGEVPISISGDPEAESSITHTIRSVGTVTEAINSLKTGMNIGVRGPYGTYWPVERSVGHDVLIVAGGIGLAPLRPAICHILNHRESYGNVTLLYGARAPEEIIFRKQLEKWRSRFDIQVLVTVDNATGDWMGRVGVVTTLIGNANVDFSDCLAFVCGPEIMMRFTVRGLIDRDIREDSIFMSLERNMKCGIGICGHCQLGPKFICKDGPVFAYDSVKSLFQKREM
jgi:NAD(P)H-flavin reductase